MHSFGFPELLVVAAAGLVVFLYFTARKSWRAFLSGVRGDDRRGR